MAVSAFQKVLNRLFKQFVNQWGREPQTPKEWMDIQNSAVQIFNTTKGVPPGAAKPPFQGFKPRVIQGGKGIESLLKSGDVKVGVAPKTKKKIDLSKYTDDDLNALANEHRILSAEAKKLGDAGEHYEKFSQLNKRTKEIEKILDAAQAVPESGYGSIKADLALQKQKKSIKKKTVEDFRDEGDWDPSGMATGGRIDYDTGGLAYMLGEPNTRIEALQHAGVVSDPRGLYTDPSIYNKGESEALNDRPGGRIGMAGGGPLFKFIEKLFIKASNDIRQGKGKWKGLDLKQRIVQHDNLTKKVVEFQKSGNTEGLEVYFDVNPHEAFAAASKKVKAQKYADEMEAEAWDKGRDTVDSLTGGIDERTALKQKYPGITDDLVEKILVDDNPQRKADVLTTVDQYMKLREVGKSEKEAYDIIVQSFNKKIPTKHAEGGGVGHGPWIKGIAPGTPEQPPQPETPVHHAQGRPDATKAPQGIPSLAPRTMDPKYIQQQRMQQMMAGMGQQRRGMEEGGFTQDDFNQFLKEREEGYREGGKYDLQKDWERYKKFKHYGLGALQEAAEGGRMGFGGGGLTRRAFMKLMAGLTALPFIGKGVSKVAPKAIPKITEQVIVRGADGMPTYINDLITVVKAKGTRDIIEGFKKSDYSTVHSYKGVDVIEEASGTTRIKQGKETPLHGSDEPAYHEIEMEIKPGEYEQIGNPQFDDAAKSVQAPDEYFEATVKPDMDGKMKDVEEFVDEVDHLELKEIADEINPLRLKVYNEDMATIKKTKKASGGLAHMLGE